MVVIVPAVVWSAHVRESGDHLEPGVVAGVNDVKTTLREAFRDYRRTRRSAAAQL